MPYNGQWAVERLHTLDPGQPPITGRIGFRRSGFRVTAANTLTISGANARLELGGNDLTLHLANYNSYKYYVSDPDMPVLECGSLVLTNGGSLAVFCAATNAAVDHGALVSLTNDLVVASGSWIYPYSHFTNGGSLLFRLRDLTIAAGGGINASGKGYGDGGTNIQNGFGPGGGVPMTTSATGGGASYGGRNALGWTRPIYGVASAPLYPGSGGAGYFSSLSLNQGGGPGGGLVRVEARDRITVDGTIAANGTSAGGYGGSGSGGGIYLACRTFHGGSAGLLQADGGDQGYNRAPGREEADVSPSATIHPHRRRGRAAGPFLRTRREQWRERARDIGTLYLSDATFLQAFATIRHAGQIVIPGFREVGGGHSPG